MVDEATATMFLADAMSHGVNGAAVVNAGPHNGYVHVPSSHPLAGKHYDDVPVDVHGGLTFSENEDDGSTWFGWDDCHSFRLGRPATEETEDLARQLAALGGNDPAPTEVTTP